MSEASARSPARCSAMWRDSVASRRKLRPQPIAPASVSTSVTSTSRPASRIERVQIERARIFAV